MSSKMNPATGGFVAREDATANDKQSEAAFLVRSSLVARKSPSRWALQAKGSRLMYMCIRSLLMSSRWFKRASQVMGDGSLICYCE